ncbi:MAG: NAD(P)H-quinone oxidoreductase [SAR324 cluster bacterium]|nr:NAD(P)H-quinone oxidoreductase [SAR324 cluster bacterium]
MKAVLVKEPGGPEQLYLGETPMPELNENEIRVKVHASAINRADTLQRRGHYPVPAGSSSVIGLEMAGEVEAAGEQVKKWKAGDRVFALLSGGGYAEYAVIHEDMAMPIPPNLGFEEAAGVAEAYLTAFQALVWLGEFAEKQNVLIHAGASGVGTAAIQLANLSECMIMATAGSEAKLQTCRDLGADLAINYKENDFSEKVLEATSGKGADIIIDFVGASYLTQNLKCIALDGRQVILGLLGGASGKEISLGAVLTKRVKIIGSTLRSRDLEYKIRLTQEFSKACLEKFETGQLKVVIDRIIPWEKASEAHQYMESNQNTGKIILKIHP